MMITINRVFHGRPTNSNSMAMIEMTDPATDSLKSVSFTSIFQNGSRESLLALSQVKSVVLLMVYIGKGTEFKKEKAHANELAAFSILGVVCQF